MGIIGIIAGVDLIRLLFVKVDKKAKNVEIRDAEIAAARHANELLERQLERANETIAKKEEDITRLQGDKEVLLTANSCLYDDMCVHKGCRMRKPHQGQGRKWYEDYKDDPSLGADYESIDTLLKKERAKRMRENVEKTADNGEI